MKANCAALIFVAAIVGLNSPILLAQDRPTDAGAAPRQKIKHDGGRDDLGAIGKRKLFKDANWYSIDTDIKMGKQQSEQLEASMKVKPLKKKLPPSSRAVIIPLSTRRSSTRSKHGWRRYSKT